MLTEIFSLLLEMRIAKKVLPIEKCYDQEQKMGGGGGGGILRCIGLFVFFLLALSTSSTNVFKKN